ncbi:hypothetical protein [Nonomuraea insulae]|uniref:Uncharacterized protein n=1 Tax=Nonomuraea insulae TaxID=1616787 RepID=A0ABW1CSP7_9ACTN
MLGPALDDGPLPDALIDAVLAAGDPVQAGRLAANGPLLAAKPWLRDRLAATGYAEVARAALGMVRDGPRKWSLRARRDVLAAARGAGWSGREGVLTELLQSPAPSRLRAAVVCPLPGAARTALSKAGSALTRAEQLRALLTVHDHDGGRAALELLADSYGLHAEVKEVVREALADASALREAVKHAEGTGGLIEELNDDRLERREDHLGLRDQIDWTAIAAADRPFDEEATTLLITRPDLPDELRALWYRTRGVLVATHSARVDPSMLTLTPGGPRAAKAVAVLVRRGMDGRPHGGGRRLGRWHLPAAVQPRSLRLPGHPRRQVRALPRGSPPHPAPPPRR